MLVERVSFDPYSSRVRTWACFVPAGHKWFFKQCILSWKCVCFMVLKMKEASRGTPNHYVALYSLDRTHWLAEKAFGCSNSISKALFALPGKHPNLAAFHMLEKDQSQSQLWVWVRRRTSQQREGAQLFSRARNITVTPTGAVLIGGGRAAGPAPQLVNVSFFYPPAK